MGYRDNDDRRQGRGNDGQQQGGWTQNGDRGGWQRDQPSQFSQRGGQQGGRDTFTRDWGGRDGDYGSQMGSYGGNHADRGDRDRGYRSGGAWGNQRDVGPGGYDTDRFEGEYRAGGRQGGGGREFASSSGHGSVEYRQDAIGGYDPQFSRNDVGAPQGGYGGAGLGAPGGYGGNPERYGQRDDRRPGGQEHPSASGRRYGLGSEQAHPHDHDYAQWRDEQIRNLDRDYDAWRQERYGKFSTEFDTWRNSRAGQPHGPAGSSSAKGIDKTGGSSPDSDTTGMPGASSGAGTPGAPGSTGSASAGGSKPK